MATSGVEVVVPPLRLSEQYFGADDRRLFRRHVLWTRLLADRRTTLPHDKDGDLLEYARRNRELLVLKPNRAYGGTGVMLGPATEQAEWEQALQKAVSRGDPENSWVVQAVTRLPVHEFPVVGPDGLVAAEYLLDEWPERLPYMAHTPNPTIPIFVVSAVAAHPQASQGAGCSQIGA